MLHGAIRGVRNRGQEEGVAGDGFSRVAAGWPAVVILRLAEGSRFFATLRMTGRLRMTGGLRKTGEDERGESLKTHLAAAYIYQ